MKIPTAMDEEKDIKPKLDYDQVIRFIDERITRIDQVAEQMEEDTMKAQSGTKRKPPCCLKRCWVKWCKQVKRWFEK